jgi:thiol:disulfide interchange protein DsbD
MTSPHRLRSRLLAILAAMLVPALAAPSAAFAGPPTGDDFLGEPDAGYGDSRDFVDVEAFVGATSVPQGGDLPVAVVFSMEPHWHIWGHDPAAYKDSFTVVTKIEPAVTPAGALETRMDLARWPELVTVTADFGTGPEEFAVYEDEAVVYVPVLIPPDAPLGATTLTLSTTFQSCDDKQCAFEATVEIPLTVEIVALGSAGAGSPPAIFDQFPRDLFTEARSKAATKDLDFDLFGLSFTLNVAGAGFLLLLAVAALGGFLLNLTPCVLPVIPLKIMGLSSAAGNRRRTLMLGTMMSLGVVGFWLALGLGIALIAGFTATNQLFQYPAFTIGVGVFIVFMAIGMCGLFSVQLPRFVYSINPSHDTAPGSFGFGIMTGILSTPCTAPFMGAAAAYAATIHPAQTLIIFAAIGLGMALPYQVLSTFPHLVDRMPRTGPSSELIKQVMGLLLLAAGAYFVGTGVSGLLVTPPQPPSTLFWWVVAAFGVSAGAWLAWRTFRISKNNVARGVFGLIGGFIVAISAWIGVAMTAKGPIDWIYYTPERFAEAKSDGNVVLMDFTAEWCLNCKALESAVLHDDRVVEVIAEDGIVPIKVDLTGNNPDGNAMLKAADRVTIPLLVIYDASGVESFKGDFYTVDQVVDAIRNAQGQQVAHRP